MRPEHSQAVDRDVHLHVEHVVTTAAPLLCRSDRPREVHECIVQRGGLRVRAEADQQAGHVPQGEPLLRPSPRSPVFPVVEDIEEHARRDGGVTVHGADGRGLVQAIPVNQLVTRPVRPLCRTRSGRLARTL